MVKTIRITVAALLIAITSIPRAAEDESAPGLSKKFFTGAALGLSEIDIEQMVTAA